MSTFYQFRERTSDHSLKQQSGNQNPIPPKSPNIINLQTPNTLSYKDKLLQDEFFVNTTQIVEENLTIPTGIQSSELEAIKPEELSHKMKQIILSENDRKRTYKPWKYFVIIKLMGKRLVHHYLKKNSGFYGR